MINLFGVLTEPMRYYRHWKSGGAVSVYVSSDDLNGLMLKFERKIEASDVVDGKLQPATHEKVKRRGGKRITHVQISYECAESLHKVLGKALKDARKRRFWHQFLFELVSMVSSMTRCNRQPSWS